jgi:hypothetical protein
VSIRALKALKEDSGSNIPDSNTLVQTPGCDVLGIWGNGNSSDTIFSTKNKNILASFNIPETNGSIATP